MTPPERDIFSQIDEVKNIDGPPELMKLLRSYSTETNNHALSAEVEVARRKHNAGVPHFSDDYVNHIGLNSDLILLLRDIIETYQKASKEYLKQRDFEPFLKESKKGFQLKHNLRTLEKALYPPAKVKEKMAELVEDGSPESLDDYERMAILEGYDPQGGIDVMVEREKADEAFSYIKKSDLLNQNQSFQREVKDYLIKKVYEALPTLRKDTSLKHITEDSGTRTYLERALDHAKESVDPDVIRIGMEANDILYKGNPDFQNVYQGNSRFLSNKVDLDENDIAYLMLLTQNTINSTGIGNAHAKQAYDLLSHHGLHQKAANVAAGCLPNREKLKSLEKAGNYVDLSHNLREKGDVVGYAMAKWKAQVANENHFH